MTVSSEFQSKTDVRRKNVRRYPVLSERMMERYGDVMEAHRTAWDTEDILATQGWCLWQCDTLDGEVVVIIRDEGRSDIPHQYTRYTENEIHTIFGHNHRINNAHIRLIHRAKKNGARVLLV